LPAFGALGCSSTINNGSIVVRNVPPRACISDAFGVRRADVIGPAWMDGARFDIVAKASTRDSSTPTLKMYQALLIERFHLHFHTGTRSDSGFELSALKSGIRLRDIGAAPADEPVFATIQRSNASHIVSSRGMTMVELARALSQRLSVPVIDKTGAPDYFAVNLEFNVPQLNGSDEPDPPNGRSTLFAALQEAGLRLESVKVESPAIFVDSVDRVPTGN